MPKPQVLIVHVPYQNRGGEDIHVETLARAYDELGYAVEFLPRDRQPPKGFGIAALLSLLPFPVAEKHFHLVGVPDVVHIHNLYPVLGPRFLLWLRKKKIPTLMTVHNHRFFCTNGLALRGSRTCKECFFSPIPWRALIHRCNQNWLKTLYHFLALSILRTSRLLVHTVDAFVAPSGYIANELKRAGIPAVKVKTIVHPVNVTPVDVAGGAKPERLRFDVVFAGRLSPEKGIDVLLDCVRQCHDLSFAIVGDGALAPQVQSATKACSNITYFPNQSHAETLNLIRNSRIGVLPSVCNEILSLFALEIFAMGKRCVVFKTDSMRWFENLSLPLHFAQLNDAQDLGSKLREALSQAEPSETEKAKIRQWLGLHRFRNEMQMLLRELIDGKAEVK